MNGNLAITLLIIAMVMLPVVYVLSAAPAIWLVSHAYLPVWVADIYEPAYHVTVARKIIEWEDGMLP